MGRTMTLYPRSYFASRRSTSLRSAREVVPLVVDVLRPNSVIDVGCGTGSWLAVFRECGVDDVMGVDGAHVPRDMLEIPEDRFTCADLNGPLVLGRSFDLAMSLEVAEHLRPAAGETFVTSLIGLAPVVLFSAAIPFQGGKRHLNEQWQDYWAQLFATADYIPVDYLRPQIWSNPHVASYYAQNTLLFGERGYIASRSELAANVVEDLQRLVQIHPRVYEAKADIRRRRDVHHVPVTRLLAAVPKSAYRSARQLWQRWATSRSEGEVTQRWPWRNRRSVK
jgi:SAM-dependent methyltransferase